MKNVLRKVIKENNWFRSAFLIGRVSNSDRI